MSDTINTLRRFPIYLPSGLHTNEVANEIEQLRGALMRIQARAETEQIGSSNSVFKWIEMVAASALFETKGGTE